MFARFFDTAAVDEYADWVIDEVKRTLPASFDPHLQNVTDKVDRLDKRISQRTQTLLQTTKLNIYTKARLAGRVQEGMTAAGYPKPFIKSFSLDLVRRVALMAKPKQAA